MEDVMKFKPHKQLLQRYKVDIKSDTVFAKTVFRLAQNLRDSICWKERNGVEQPDEIDYDAFIHNFILVTTKMK